MELTLVTLALILMPDTEIFNRCLENGEARVKHGTFARVV